MNRLATGNGAFAQDNPRRPELVLVDGSRFFSGRSVDPLLARRFEVASGMLAWGMVLLGAGVLAGWWLDIEVARRVMPGLNSMKANAAAGFVLSGAAVLLHGLGGKPAQAMAQLLGTLVCALGTATLSQDLFDWDLEIDQLLANVHHVAGESSGRMAPTAALGFALGGLALAARAGRGLRRRQIAVCATTLMGLLALFGYLFGAQSLYGIGTYSSMAVHTAFGMLMLALGMLFATPRQGWMAVLSSGGVDGMLARRLLPAALAVPLLLAAIERIGEASMWYERSFGLAAFCLLLIALLVVGIWRTGRSLAAEEARFRATFEQAAVGIALVALDGRWLRVNERLCRITGYPRDELLQRTFQQLTHPEDLAADLAHVRRLLGGEIGHYEMEKRYFRKDGSILWAHLTVALVRQAGGMPDYFVSVVEDVSERKAMQLALQESSRRLEQFNSELARQVAQRTQELEERARDLKAAKEEADRANQAKSDFLANISHEIRTPMNAILGTAQVLERCELNGEQRHLVHTIRGAGRGLLAIINDVLDLAKIEAGRFELEQAPFVLRNVLSNLTDVLFASAADKGLALEVAPLPAGVDALVGDAQRLGQVLFNLAGNAIKFTPRGSVTVSVHLVEQQAGQVMLRFAVRDTGIGIESSQLDRLFEAFVQADTGRRYGGTGLGLAISRQLVKLMGGEIGVHSRPGHGSEFWFIIPFAVASARPAADTAAAGSRHGRRLAGLRVFVVDDSRVNQEVACRLLALEGAATEVADNGSVALERLRAGPADFDIVLMDVQMPVLDGLDAVRRMREEAALAALPVIALTAGALPSQRERAFAAGMNDFIAKPFELDAMVATILRRAAGRLPCDPAPADAPAAAPPADGEAFPHVPGIDTRRAARRLLGNRALFLSSLRNLCGEFADAAAQTRADLERGDAAAAQARMHKLRGVAGNLSAENIAGLAGTLEDELRAGRRDGFAQALDQLGAALDELVAGLPREEEAAADARPAAAVQAGQDGLARAELERLIVELAAQDVGAIRRFRALQDRLAARHGAQAVAAVAEQVEALRFVEAKDALRVWYPEP